MIKKQDKKFRFNIVDGFVIFLLLICIASIVGRALVINDKYQVESPKDYVVEFVVENIDQVKKSAIDNLSSGEAVVVLPDGLKLGALDGEVVCSDDIKTATGHLVINGVIEDGILKMVNGVSISINDEIEIATERVQITVKIVSIQQ